MMVGWLRRLLCFGPCERCGVEGGDRWTRFEKVENRLVKRHVCSSCSRAIFFRPWLDPNRDWRP